MQREHLLSRLARLLGCILAEDGSYAQTLQVPSCQHHQYHTPLFFHAHLVYGRQLKTLVATRSLDREVPGL